MERLAAGVQDRTSSMQRLNILTRRPELDAELKKDQLRVDRDVSSARSFVDRRPCESTPRGCLSAYDNSGQAVSLRTGFVFPHEFQKLPPIFTKYNACPLGRSQTATYVPHARIILRHGACL